MIEYNEIISKILANEDVKEQLHLLRDEIKKCESKEKISEELRASKECFENLLDKEDPKIRRFVIQIMAMLGWQEELDLIIQTYQKEETMYVRADYLEAIEKLDYSSALPFMKERLNEIMAMDASEELKGHLGKECTKLYELIAKKEGVNKHTFLPLQEEQEILLTTKAELADITLAQLRKVPRKRVPGGVMVKTKELDSLFDIRTYDELLFYVGKIDIDDASPEDLARKIVELGTINFIGKSHREKHPMGVRIQLEENMDREKKGQFIRRLAVKLMDLSDGRIFNATTGYETEIRLQRLGSKGYRVLVKFYTMQRNRFAYRKEVVSASIKPYMAANLIKIAEAYLKPGAQILDPFCGVGTMLIERRMLVPAADTYGIDVFGEAIKSARKNSEKVGPNIHYIQRDFRDFTHSYKFDEIITDMPTMTKNVDRQEVKGCYELLFSKGKELLNDGAVLIVYGDEQGFMKQQLRKNKEFSLLREFVVEERLDKRLYVIGYKKK